MDKASTIDEEGKQLTADPSLTSWTLLFKRVRFFARYEHFVQVDILSQDEQEHYKWLSYVETKLQKLSDSIYKDLKEHIQEMRVCPRPFKRCDTFDNSNDGFAFCESYFIGMKFSRQEVGQFDLRPTVYSFCLLIDM